MHCKRICTVFVKHTTGPASAWPVWLYTSVSLPALFCQVQKQAAELQAQLGEQTTRLVTSETERNGLAEELRAAKVGMVKGCWMASFVLCLGLIRLQ